MMASLHSVMDPQYVSPPTAVPAVMAVPGVAPPMMAGGMDKRRQLSQKDKLLVVKLHEYFKMHGTGGVEGAGRTPPRKRTAEVLGIGEATVARVVADFNRHGGAAFTPAGKRSGRPKVVTDDTYGLVRRIVFELHAAVQPVSVPRIVARLRDDYGIAVKEGTLRNAMQASGFRCKKSRGRRFMAERPEIVSWRARYLRKKIENRNEAHLPRRPEIVIDQMFTSMPGPDGAKVDEDDDTGMLTPLGQRWCILGAGVLHVNETGQLLGAWVRDSVAVWNASTKRRANNRPRKRSASGMDLDFPKLDMNMMESERDTGIDAKLFEEWFEGVCMMCTKEYGACLLIMDGAKYRKRRPQPPVPRCTASRVDLQEWLRANAVSWTQDMKRAELYELARAHAAAPQYVVVDIAHRHGHEVLFIPPLHRELTPIKTVWETVSHAIAVEISHNATDPDERIRRLVLTKIGIDTWGDAFRQVQKWEDEYWARDDEFVASDEGTEVLDSVEAGDIVE